MEPQIRYARTPDGVNLAWYAVGAGYPLLWMPAGPYTNIEYEWRIPETRELLTNIADRMTLIRYDTRGFSSSDRDSLDFSVETMVSDLETVVNATGFDRLVILTPGTASIPGLVYASRHPDMVAALILNPGVARGADGMDEDYERSLRIARGDWEVAIRLLGGTARLWSLTATVTALQDMLDRSTTQDAYIKWHEAVAEWDATDVLGEVQVPTLVMTDNDHVGRELAVSIPNARFVNTSGRGNEENSQVAASFIVEVLTQQPAAAASTHGTRTVLFTDIVGHTEMMQRLGDARGRDVLREHERITRDTLKAHGGTEVKTMGDGFMASFGSVTAAAECAIALQRAFAAWNDTRATTGERDGPKGASLQVRVGLNAGEPIEEDGDLFGAAVILASRIAANAGAGEILVPDTVRGLLAGKGFVFGDRGEFVPKGFDEGVRIWDVRWQA
jgi:class 3 adenylate cyclase